LASFGGSGEFFFFGSGVVFFLGACVVFFVDPGVVFFVGPGVVDFVDSGVVDFVDSSVVDFVGPGVVVFVDSGVVVSVDSGVVVFVDSGVVGFVGPGVVVFVDSGVVVFVDSGVVDFVGPGVVDFGASVVMASFGSSTLRSGLRPNALRMGFSLAAFFNASSTAFGGSLVLMSTSAFTEPGFRAVTFALSTFFSAMTPISIILAVSLYSFDSGFFMAGSNFISNVNVVFTSLTASVLGAAVVSGAGAGVVCPSKGLHVSPTVRWQVPQHFFSKYFLYLELVQKPSFAQARHFSLGSTSMQVHDKQHLTAIIFSIAGTLHNAVISRHFGSSSTQTGGGASSAATSLQDGQQLAPMNLNVCIFLQ
jgi:hypothetical protein